MDTDNVPAQDSRVGDLTQNVTEAALVHQVTESLIGCGVLEEEIGIISLYRQQIKLLSHLLQERKRVEILTADRSQGRDKECIIISMVRSNDVGQVGFRFCIYAVQTIHCPLDRRLAERLEKDQRFVHTCPFEADRLRFPSNVAVRTVTPGIFQAHGKQRVDLRLAARRRQVSPYSWGPRSCSFSQASDDRSRECVASS